MKLTPVSFRLDESTITSINNHKGNESLSSWLVDAVNTRLATTPNVSLEERIAALEGRVDTLEVS